MNLELIDEHSVVTFIIGQRGHHSDVVGQADGAKRPLVAGTGTDGNIVGEVRRRRRRAAIADEKDRVAGFPRIEKQPDKRFYSGAVDRLETRCKIVEVSARITGRIAAMQFGEFVDFVHGIRISCR